MTKKQLQEEVDRFKTRALEAESRVRELERERDKESYGELTRKNGSENQALACLGEENRKLWHMIRVYSGDKTMMTEITDSNGKSRHVDPFHCQPYMY